MIQTIQVNDETRELAKGQTLFGLVREMGLAERKGVALAVNGAVALRTEWPTRTLSAGDRILVIQATQGG